MSGKVKMIELLVSLAEERFKGKHGVRIGSLRERSSSWEIIHNVKNPRKLMEIKQKQISFLSKFALMGIMNWQAAIFPFGGICNFYTGLKFVSKTDLSFVEKSIKSFIWAVVEDLIKV